MRMQTKTWAALLTVFVSGIVIGFFSGQAYLHWRVQNMRRRGPVALQEFMLKRIQRQLHPTTEQLPTIENVLKQVAQEMDEQRLQNNAKLWQSMRNSLSQMQPVLTTEQKQVLDGMDLEDLLPGPPPNPPVSQTPALPAASG